MYMSLSSSLVIRVSLSRLVVARVSEVCLPLYGLQGVMVTVCAPDVCFRTGCIDLVVLISFLKLFDLGLNFASRSFVALAAFLQACRVGSSPLRCCPRGFVIIFCLEPRGIIVLIALLVACFCECVCPEISVPHCSPAPKMHLQPLQDVLNRFHPQPPRLKQRAMAPKVVPWRFPAPRPPDPIRPMGAPCTPPAAVRQAPMTPPKALGAKRPAPRTPPKAQPSNPTPEPMLEPTAKWAKTATTMVPRPPTKPPPPHLIAPRPPSMPPSPRPPSMPPPPHLIAVPDETPTTATTTTTTTAVWPAFPKKMPTKALVLSKVAEGQNASYPPPCAYPPSPSPSRLQ